MIPFARGTAALLCSLTLLITQAACATQPQSIPGDWQPLIAACPEMRPLQPLASLPSTAHLQMTAHFEQGLVVRKTVRIIKGIEDRRAQRMALHHLDTAMRFCPGVQTLHAEVVIGPQQAGFQRVQIDGETPAIRQN